MNSEQDHEIYTKLTEQFETYNLERRQYSELLEGPLVPEAEEIISKKLSELDEQFLGGVAIGEFEVEWIENYSDADRIAHSISALRMLIDKSEASLSDALNGHIAQIEKKASFAQNLKGLLVVTGIIEAAEAVEVAAEEGAKTQTPQEVAPTRMDDDTKVENEQQLTYIELIFDENEGSISINYGTSKEQISYILGSSVKGMSEEDLVVRNLQKIYALMAVIEAKRPITLAEIMDEVDPKDLSEKDRLALSRNIRLLFNRLRIDDQRIIYPTRKGKEAPYIVHPNFNVSFASGNREELNVESISSLPIEKQDDSPEAHNVTNPEAEERSSTEVLISFIGSENNAIAIGKRKSISKRPIYLLNRMRRADTLEEKPLECRIAEVIQLLAENESEEGYTSRELYRLITDDAKARAAPNGYFDAVYATLQTIKYKNKPVFERYKEEGKSWRLRVSKGMRVIVDPDIHDKVSDDVIRQNAVNRTTVKRTKKPLTQSTKDENDSEQINEQLNGNKTINLEQKSDTADDILTQADVLKIVKNLDLDKYTLLPKSSLLNVIKSLVETDEFKRAASEAMKEAGDAVVNDAEIERIKQGYIAMLQDDSKRQLILSLPKTDIRRMFVCIAQEQTGANGGRSFTIQDIKSHLFKIK